LQSGREENTSKEKKEQKGKTIEKKKKMYHGGRGFTFLNGPKNLSRVDLRRKERKTGRRQRLKKRKRHVLRIPRGEKSEKT